MHGNTLKIKDVVVAMLCLPLTALARHPTLPLDSRTGFPPCDALIAANLSSRIVTAASPAYEPRIQSYWHANGRLHPWCLFQPQTTQELSTAISTLAKTGNGAGDWHIAVRSGGHSYPGSNNIDRGITIDLGHMNGSWCNSDCNTASLEPGAHWRNTYANLHDKFNVTVTGGRDGDVGVGGFLLGGGVSYYTGTNGFGCDTVVNYEVVLADGTIVQANASSHADLFRALKGGGLNFGIVTRFDVEAMPAGDIAHGLHTVAGEYSDDVVESLVEFTERTAKRPHDHLVSLFMHRPGDNGTIVVSMRANTKGNMKTTAFANLTAIPALASTWNRTSLADAANATQADAGLRSAFSTLTFLLSPTILHHATTLHATLVSRLTARIGPSFFSAIMLQPIPTSYAPLSHRNGGSMIGPALHAIPGNAIMWTANIGVAGDDADFAVAEAEMLRMTAKLEAKARKEGVWAGWRYLNYAHPGQDVFGGYGEESLRVMRKVARRYDGEGFWQRRVPGGFKLARAG